MYVVVAVAVTYVPAMLPSEQVDPQVAEAMLLAEGQAQNSVGAGEAVMPDMEVAEEIALEIDALL